MGVLLLSQSKKKRSPPTRLASLATLPTARFARGGREKRYSAACLTAASAGITSRANSSTERSDSANERSPNAARQRK